MTSSGDCLAQDSKVLRSGEDEPGEVQVLVDQHSGSAVDLISSDSYPNKAEAFSDLSSEKEMCGGENLTKSVICDHLEKTMQESEKGDVDTPTLSPSDDMTEYISKNSQQIRIPEDSVMGSLSENPWHLSISSATSGTISRISIGNISQLGLKRTEREDAVEVADEENDDGTMMKTHAQYREGSIVKDMTPAKSASNQFGSSNIEREKTEVKSRRYWMPFGCCSSTNLQPG